MIPNQEAFLFHFPERKKESPIISGAKPATESPYQQPRLPMPKVKHRRAAKPIRRRMPSTRATARFSYVFPEPFISAKAALLVAAP